MCADKYYSRSRENSLTLRVCGVALPSNAATGAAAGIDGTFSWTQGTGRTELFSRHDRLAANHEVPIFRGLSKP